MDSKKAWRDYFENVLVAILLALLFRTYILTGYKVPNDSMAPSLIAGDFIFSFRLPYGLKLPFSSKKLAGRPPMRGELVVYTPAAKPNVRFVRRVIGLPGDVLQIEKGQFKVNGELLSFKGEGRLIRQNWGPIVVPPGEVFLVTDSPAAVAEEAQFWQTTPMERIDGSVKMIWLSLDRDPAKDGTKGLPSVRWSRIFTFL